MLRLKHWMIIVAVVGWSAPAVAQGQRQPEIDGFNGPVRSVKEEEQVLSNGRAGPSVQQTRQTRETHYDRAGNRVLMTYYFADGSKEVWKYPADKTVASQDIHYTPEGNIERKYVYHYGADGRVAEKDTYYGAVLSFKDKYAYTSYGDGGWKQVDTTFGPVGNDPKDIEVQTFNHWGNPTEDRMYDGAETLLPSYKYFYDSNGFPVGNVLTRADGSILRKQTIIRDSTECAVEIDVYGVGGKPESKSLFGCGNQGTPVSAVRLNADGTPVGTESWVYDGCGNELDDQQYGADASLLDETTNSYQIDAHGNWIVDIETNIVRASDGSYSEHQKVTRRTITYY